MWIRVVVPTCRLYYNSLSTICIFFYVSCEVKIFRFSIVLDVYYSLHFYHQGNLPPIGDPFPCSPEDLNPITEKIFLSFDQYVDTNHHL